jgi:tetratricopeptide (TPR) repeat protein
MLAILLPILVVAVIELALRLCGLGGYAPMFRKLGAVPGGNLVVAEQGGAASWFFANSGRAGTSEQYTFIDPKPTNTVRVLLVGESAIQGYPQPRHLSASAFLQLMLQDAWPDRRVEVINLGTTAIASYPVLEIVTEALNYEPDLVVVYTGHNEFFGTYGVASIGRAGSRPWMLKANRWLHSLAIVQGLHGVLRRRGSTPDRTLMEEMMGQAYIAPDDGQRSAAANTLYYNVSEMIRRGQARGVRMLICSLPTNERGLAPIGVDKLDHLPAATQQEITAQLSAAEAELSASPSLAIPPLQRVIQLDPTHARAHFLLGQAFTALARHSEALEQYIAARDLDTMPWRAPSQSLQSILRAAKEQNAPVCDLVSVFRTNSPGQAIGWELMDDHVHPTLRGQALIAQGIVESLATFDQRLRVTPEARGRLPDWSTYVQRLGTNIYDTFAVAHNMRLLFAAPFMRRNNPEPSARYDDIVYGIEKQLTPETRDVLHQWQATRPFEGSRCPVSAAVAQLRMKQDAYQEALELYQIALRDVPPYTSWFLEYTYYGLLCRQKLARRLSPAEKQQAHSAIDQGRFLSEHVPTDFDFTERYTGLLHLLCGEFREAIPHLRVVEAQQTGIDRLAIDQALVVCFLQTGQFSEAREVLASGSGAAGEYTAQYRILLAQLAALEKNRETNSSFRTNN